MIQAKFNRENNTIVITKDDVSIELTDEESTNLRSQFDEALSKQDDYIMSRYLTGQLEKGNPFP